MMAPSPQSVLVLLGLVASIRALPRAVPEVDVAARQAGLDPPSYSVSWGLQPPASTEPPVIEDPEPEDPEDPVPQPPQPTDQISLSPPSFTVSWDPPLPTTTKKPGFPGWSPKPKPTKKTTTKPSVTATVTWNKRQFDYDPEPTDISEDPEEPQDPELPEDPEDPDVPSFPTGKDSIGIQPPKATITWGKRDDTNPPPPTFGIGIPTYTFVWPKPPKPTATITWGKRQDEGEPTEIAPPGEEPTDIAPPQQPDPSDEITLNPPTATITWGKRQDEGEPTDIAPPQQPDPSDEVTFNPPTATITWGKREAEAQYKSTKKPKPTSAKPKPSTTAKPKPTSTAKPKPTTTSETEPTTTSEYEDEPTDAVPPIPDPSDEISISPPTATITWGKRDDVEAPPPTFGLGKPTYTFVWPEFPKPTATVTWGKREAEADAQTDSWGVVWPTNIPTPTWPAISTYTGPGYISWAKRDASPEPTAAPELVDVEARAAQFTCGSSTTVSSIRPCPRIGCSPPCEYTPELFEPVPDPPYDPDHTDIRCPIVKTATNKCPTCACPTTFLSILPTKSTKPVTTKTYPTKPPHSPTITNYPTYA